MEDNNGNVLIKGTDLTPEQKSMLKFHGMKNELWVKCHSFWFKHGQPSQEEGYYYPVCDSWEFLRH